MGDQVQMGKSGQILQALNVLGQEFDPATAALGIGGLDGGLLGLGVFAADHTNREKMNVVFVHEPACVTALAADGVEKSGVSAAVLPLPVACWKGNIKDVRSECPEPVSPFLKQS